MWLFKSDSQYTTFYSKPPFHCVVYPTSWHSVD